MNLNSVKQMVELKDIVLYIKLVEIYNHNRILFFQNAISVSLKYAPTLISGYISSYCITLFIVTLR